MECGIRDTYVVVYMLRMCGRVYINIKVLCDIIVHTMNVVSTVSSRKIRCEAIYYIYLVHAMLVPGLFSRNSILVYITAAQNDSVPRGSF